MTSTAGTLIPQRVKDVKTSRGENMALWSWDPVGPERGVVVIYHGYNTHARFPMIKYTAQLLAECGLRCFCADLPGHGVSDNVRGCRALFLSCDAINNDSLAILRAVQAQVTPGSRIFLCGSSMGGALALNVSRRVPTEIEGVLLLAPMLKQSRHNIPHPVVQAILRKIVPLFPGWAVISANVTEPALCASCPARRAEVAQDVIDMQAYAGKVRLGTAAVLLDTTLELHANLEDVTVPFWVGVGGQEVVVDPSGPEDLYARASTDTQNKTFKLYAEARHGLLAEVMPLRGIIESDIRDWMHHRLSLPPRVL